jgi:hypothetical protein
MAGFAESGMRDLAGGDASSQGALQLLAGTASSMGINPHDEKAIASAFFQQGFTGKGGANKLAASGLPAQLVAQGVQGSAFSDGSNYLAQAGAAKDWMRRYGLRAGGQMPTLDKGGHVKRAGLAEVHPGDIHRSSPEVTVYINGDGAALLDDIEVMVDGKASEFAEFTIREGGRNLARGRQLPGRAGRG